MTHKLGNYPALVPYLHLENSGDFAAFAAEAFGATVVQMNRTDDGVVVHGDLEIEGSLVAYSTARPEWPATRSSFCLYVRDVDAVYARAVGAGATSLHEPQEQDYGERSGGVRDPWGNAWYLSTVTDLDKRLPQV